MDRAKTTPKDFFLWAGAMIALYWSVISFIFLVFNYIDYALPNPLSYLPEPYESGIPYEMSSILILVPLSLILLWLIRRDIAHDKSRAAIWVRRWALMLTLFVSGLAVVVDLVTLLTAFFRGESLTESFLLKVLLVLCVAAVVFMHFLADLWGYWQQFPRRNRAVGIGVLALALIAVFGGFFIVGTPQQARQYQFDEQRVNDLQTIQSQIISYWQAKGALPASLSDLNDSISGFTAPLDPQTSQPYEYKRSSPLDFELCAAFNAPTPPYAVNSYPTAPMGASGASESWQHEAGQDCFDRSIDPQLYPPVSKRS